MRHRRESENGEEGVDDEEKGMEFDDGEKEMDEREAKEAEVQEGGIRK